MDDVPECIKERIKNMDEKKKEEFITKYKKALVDPGEAVGTVAAQSIGPLGELSFND